MIYRLIWPFARLGCLLYFRKIFLIGAERMPSTGPLLVVCNHPSSFFEACLLAVLLPRPLYFLTRGDFFAKPLFSWFLRQTHQVPIFRTEDGFDKLRTNQDTFAYCYAALREGKVIVIFPESRTETEKRLRLVQKGAARIAFGSLRTSSSTGPFRIFPIGVTFSNPVMYRSLVTIRCGEILQVTELPNDDRQGVADTTELIERALKTHMIIIHDPDQEDIFDAYQDLLFNSADIADFPSVSTSSFFPGIEEKLACFVNQMTSDQVSLSRQNIRRYRALLLKTGLTDRYMTSVFPWTLPGKLALLPGVILVGIGKLITAPPAWSVERILRGRVRRIPFYGPTKWALGMVAYPLWFAFILAAGFMVGAWPGLMIGLICVMCAFLNMQHFHDLAMRGFLGPLLIRREVLIELRERRSRILQDLPEGIG